jgi:hypothetical protein
MFYVEGIPVLEGGDIVSGFCLIVNFTVVVHDLFPREWR